MVNYQELHPRLTALDLTILTRLTKPCRLNYSEIAKNLNVSREAVRKRFGKYQKLGYITCQKIGKEMFITPHKSLKTQFTTKNPYIIMYWKVPADMSVAEMKVLTQLCKWRYFARHKENIQKNSKGFWVKYDILAKQTELTMDSLKIAVERLKKRGMIEVTTINEGFSKNFFKIKKKACELIVNILTKKNEEIKNYMEKEGWLKPIRRVKNLTKKSTKNPFGCQPKPRSESRIIENNILNNKNKYNLYDYTYLKDTKINQPLKDSANATSLRVSPTHSHPEICTYGARNLEVTFNKDKPHPPYSPPFPIDCKQIYKKRRWSFLSKFSNMINNIRMKHKEKKVSTLTQAIAVYRSVIGDDEALTPQEKNMLRAIMKYCQENNIDLRLFLEKANDKWKEVRNKFGQVLSFAGYDITKPTIPAIYNHRVMKFLVKEIKKPEDRIIKIKYENGIYIAIMSDGRGKVLSKEQVEKIKEQRRAN